MHTALHPSLAYVVEQLAHTLQQRGWFMTTAESCTGGGIAAACTDAAGSSAWFERGFITYSNAAKTELLAVEAALIEQHGAVSEPVVRAMAQGAVAHAHAHVSVAVTGIAGPSGGSAHKPVGTVWLAWHVAGVTKAHCIHFNGDRAAIRAATVHMALTGLLALCQAAPPAH
jgi:nicotinamide-nucleotide amidase